MTVWGQPNSQLTDFNVRLWQAEDGLPNNIVESITQTADGFLWVGTREGLAQFDGEQFHVVELSPGSSQPTVSSLLACADDSLWVGTEGAGVYCLGHGKPRRIDFPGTNPPPDVQEIRETRDGVVWFGTTRGVYFWQDGKLQRLAKLRNLQARFCADNSGKIWACDGNLKRIDPPAATNGSVLAVKVPRATLSLYCDADGVFWIGTDHGVNNSLIQVKDNQVTIFAREPGPAGFVSVIFKDSSGNLWIGSYAGLSRFVDGNFFKLKISAGSPCRIYCVFEDTERDVWVGSEEGLTRLTARKFKTISKADGLSGNTVVSICFPGREISTSSRLTTASSSTSGPMR